MVNLRNKFLLKVFNDKFLNYKFLIICHSFYLTTVEFNLLRHYCKLNNISCLNPKNKVTQQMLVKNSLVNFSNIFVSYNLLFFGNSFLDLINFYKIIKLENTKLIPLTFTYYNRIFILNNNVLLEQMTEKTILNQLLNFIFYYNLIIFFMLQKINFKNFNYFYYANINAIN